MAIAAGQLGALLADMTVTRPAYRHLAAAVRGLILEGRIAVDVRLPAERELAPALSLSRTTISAAYELLRQSGYARSRRGSGTWTALPEGPPEAIIDLATVALSLPQDVLSRDLAEVAVRLPHRARTPGHHPFGLPELRTAIAERYTQRGLPTEREQILVTAGAQQALSLTLSLLCRPGDRVLVESSSYPNALDAIRRAQLRTVPVPVTDEGWDGEVLVSALRQAVPRLAYLIPCFHNPTGALMPAGQCADVLDAARRPGTWTVVDETLVDMALDTEVPRPFAAYAGPPGAGHVISIGSLSKCYWGGLRVGWLRASPSLVAELAALRATFDVTGSVLDQLLAVSLLDRADDWIAGRVAQVRRQRRVLSDALSRHMPQWSWQQPPGGLSLWVDLGRPVAAALAKHSPAHGVHIGEGARFGAEPGTFEHRLRIPYTLPPDVLEEAVRRLGEVLADPSVDSGSPPDRVGWTA